MNSPLVVLLIEDSEDDVFFFRRALKKACPDCQFTHVPDGSAAVQTLDQAATGGCVMPDLIYLDLKMPVMNGFEVLDWIRLQPFAASLRLTVLSGSDQEKDRHRAKSLGASRYLVKPVTPQDLQDDLVRLRDTLPGRGDRPANGKERDHA